MVKLPKTLAGIYYQNGNTGEWTYLTEIDPDNYYTKDEIDSNERVIATALTKFDDDIVTLQTTVEENEEITAVALSDLDNRIINDCLPSSTVIPKGVFKVTITENNGTYTSDKTASQIYQAYLDGYAVFCESEPFCLFPLLITQGDAAFFTTYELGYVHIEILNSTVTVSNGSFLTSNAPCASITSAKIAEWNGKEDKQVVRLDFYYNQNAGTITFTDSDGNSLTHSEVRELLNNTSKDVRLFDTGNDMTLFDMSITKGNGYEDEWEFTSLGGMVTYYIALRWSNNSIAVISYGETDLVPTSRTVNNKSLTSNITLTASDVGAMATTHPANAITSADITEWDGKAEKVTVETVSTSGSVTQALLPNKFYNFTGSLTSLTLTLTAGNGTELDVYAGKFIADSSGCSVTLPQTVTVADSVPAIEGGNTYEFNIVDNVLIYIKV